MICSINFLNRIIAIALVFLACLTGCAAERIPLSVTQQVQKKMRIAVYPVDNLSGSFVQMQPLRDALIARVKSLGLDVMDDETLEGTLERHRIRYIGGVDSEAAKAFKEETGADAVLLTSLEYFNEIFPPKIALISRLTTTGDNPRIIWMDSVGISGDDSPGILGLGLINDLPTLQGIALDQLAESLVLSLQENGMLDKKIADDSKYKPKQFYSSAPLASTKKTTIAVVPFYNDSLRRRAGDIMQAHFTDQLERLPDVTLIEPGIIREKMLGIRMIMPEGVSFRDVDVLTYILDADFVLSGSIFDYQDPKGGSGTPKIDFSSLMINRGERKVVMLAKSYNKGDDGVFFYDVGRENNANVMADKMSGNIVLRLEEENRSKKEYRFIPPMLVPQIKGMETVK